MNDAIQDYLGKKRQQHSQGLVPKRVDMPHPPIVQEQTKDINVPSEVWMNSQFGTPEALFHYLETENHVPHEAKLEIDMDIHTKALRLKYTWWTVEIKHTRHATL